MIPIPGTERMRIMRPSSWLLAALIPALIVGATWLAARWADRELRAELLQQARMVAMAVNVQQVAALHGTAADVALPYYLRLKEQLSLIRDANPRCRFLYLMQRRPNGLIFINADSEPAGSSDYSPPGQAYADAPRALYAVFATGRETVRGPYNDRRGTWVSAFVPLHAGVTGTVLGMDIDAAGWRWNVAARAALPAALATLAVMLGLLAALLQRSRRAIRTRDTNLRESEARFCQLAEQLPVISYIVELLPVPHTVYISPQVQALLGFTPAEWLADPALWVRQVAAEDRDLMVAEVARHNHTGQSFFLEYRVLTRDGRIVWLRNSANYQADSAGRLVAVHGVMQDISERKQADRILNDIIDENPMSIQIIDRGGFTLKVNPAHTRLFGAVPPPGYSVFTDFQLLQQGFGDLLEQVKNGAVVDFPDIYYNAHALVAAFPDVPVWLHMLVFPIFDSQGQPDRFVLMHENITARKQAEEQIRTLLAESNQARIDLLGILEDHTRAEADLKRLATVIEQAAEIIVVTDAQGLIQYVNPAFEAVTGYTRAEAIGQNPRLLKSGQQDAAYYHALWQAICSGNTWQGRFVNRKKNGALYTEEATISPVRDAAGTIANYVAVKRDISADLNLEAQLSQARKMESVGRLAGGVAHDFNNILQAILGGTELVIRQTDPADPRCAELAEIQSAARRAADLTRQLLAFASKQTIAPRILDLNDTVEGMLKMLRRLIAENIELVWAPHAGMWPIRMDPSQVDQIMANLCVNARDAIDAIDGIGAIHIATGNVHVDEMQAAHHDGLQPGDYVVLTVSDTGCGMDKATLSNIFEPFYTTKA
ncbi:MAG: PAS domain S-box protein, partial [bacterium]|nr:PAS domain S-box protein [bacterium]